MNTRGLLVAALAWLSVGCATRDFSLAGIPGKTEFASDADWAAATFGGKYRIFNNPWNKNASSGPYHQKVFLKNDNGKPVFGWIWKWRDSTNVATYPEVLVGHSPWQGEIAPNSGFPFPVGRKRLVVDYDVTMDASGAYNLAFEFWTVSALPVVKDRITHEVMIWIASDHMSPAGSRIAMATIDGKEFAIYHNPHHGDASGGASNKWGIVSLVAVDPQLKGPLDLGAVISYLQNLGLLSPSEFVVDLELGNEVMRGSGTTVVRNYDVRVE
jgi:hypothetical protein